MDLSNIQKIIKYVNDELKQGRTMKDIEINDFKVNERVLVKRLNRKGYKRIKNQFLYCDRSNISLYNQENNKNIHSYNKCIMDESKQLELLELLEPIKEILAEYKYNSITCVELKPKAVKEVKQKLFKVEINVLNDWEEFVNDHKEYKVQQLITLALEEFIEKYK